jgi:hypothetical protein
MKLTNFNKNRMGTISFDMQLPKWRKAQEFIVYPMSEKSEKILIQSEKRWAEIDVKTGQMKMTNGKGGHPNSWLLVWQEARGESEAYVMSEVDLSALKMQIFMTAGDEVGGVVISNNSGAFNII